MRALSRSWDGMTPSERIVAMSLATGGVIAIVNSTVWAIAACFMSYQRSRVRLAQARLAEAQPEEDAGTPTHELAEGVAAGAV